MNPAWMREILRKNNDGHDPKKQHQVKQDGIRNRNLELLTVKCQTFYFPQEFTSASGELETALFKLQEGLTQHMTIHRDAAFIMAMPTSGAHFQPSTNTSPAPPGEETHWITVILQSWTVTRQSPSQCSHSCFQTNTKPYS